MSKRLILLVTLLLNTVATYATPKISLLTCGPTDDYVFYMYGHTAIRVQEQGQDLVYNYGYFSLQQEHFYINFIIGKPMYSLGVTYFEDFLYEYSQQGRSVVEQELNLTQEESELLANKLAWNALPENRDYQYSFYFDNCATRPRDMIEEAVGEITYKYNTNTLPTFRESIRKQSHTAVWYTMGADMCLGCKSDQQMTLRDAAFLPSYLEDEMDTAIRGDNHQPLVTNKVVWTHQTKEISNPLEKYHIPLILFVTLGAILLLRRPHRFFIIYHKVIYSILSIGGIVVWFLAIVSEHPHTWPNANMLLLHPVWLALAYCIDKKSCAGLNKWLYFCNFVAIVIYLGLGLLLQVLPRYFAILAVAFACDQYLLWKESRRVVVK